MKIGYGMTGTILITFAIGSINAPGRAGTFESKIPRGGTVLFDHIPNSSLIVLPVMINDHGPYKFLLDTGTTKTVVSAKIADKLGIPKGRVEMLFSPGGNLPVTARTLKVLAVGSMRLDNIEIVTGNLPLMKTLRVDGLLGGDYLRRFKISIDYDNGIVDLEPCCDETISSLLT